MMCIKLFSKFKELLSLLFWTVIYIMLQFKRKEPQKAESHLLTFP